MTEPAATKFSRAGASGAVLFAALPLATLVGSLLLGPFVALAGLIGAPWMKIHRAAVSAGLPLYIALAFFAWIGASMLWSKQTHQIGDIAVFGPCAILFVYAAGGRRAADQSIVRRAGAAGLAVVLALVMVEARFNYPVSRQLVAPSIVQMVKKPAPAAAQSPALVQEDAPTPVKTRDSDASFFAGDASRAATVALLCFWGAAAMLAPFGVRGAIGMAALAGGVVGLSLQFGDTMNLVALGFGLAAAGVAALWPRATVSMLAQLIAGAIVFAPLILPQIADLAAQAYKLIKGIDAPFGWQARTEMWDFASDRIREKLFLGWGFEASGGFTETYNLLGFTLPYFPRHPHNAPLQIWLETGAVGALLAAGALASFGRRAGAALAEHRGAAAAAAGLLVTAAVFANVNMNAWAIWWWGAVAAAAALVRAARRPS